MSEPFIHLDNLSVKLNQLVFMPHVGVPPEKPYGFVYYLSIENNTPYTIHILARKWLVRESNGQVLVVEGEGVVGEKPLLTPGDAFTYNSCHIVGADSLVSGSFFGVIQEDGRKVSVAIPEFSLEIPD